MATIASVARAATAEAQTNRSFLGRSVPRTDVSGASLTEIGLAIPAQRTLTALVVLIEAV